MINLMDRVDMPKRNIENGKVVGITLTVTDRGDDFDKPVCPENYTIEYKVAYKIGNYWFITWANYEDIIEKEI